MIRRRAAVLTINSIRGFSKVHSNRNSIYKNSLDKISSFTLTKTLNTAAERIHFQTEIGNSDNFQGEFQQNPDGFHSEKPSAFQLNQTDGFRGNPSNYQQNFVVQNRNPNGENDREFQRNPDSFYINSSKDFQQSPNGYYRENSSVQGTHGSYSEPRKIVQQPNGFQLDNNSELQRSQNGYYKQNTGEFQQYPNSASSGHFGQSANWNYAGREGGFQQNQDGFHSEKPGAFQLKQTDVYKGNPSKYQENLVVQNRNPNEFYKEDDRELQRNPNSFYCNNAKDFQQNPNGSYGEPRNNLQRPNGFQLDINSELQRSQNGYNEQNIVEVQKNTNGHFGTSLGQFGDGSNGNSGGPKGGFLNQDGFQKETSNQSEGEVIQTTGQVVQTTENQYMGTIDQLDTFCKEGNVKETVRVLSLLEKQGIDVDLPRYLLLMQVCGDVVATQEAKAIHNHLRRSGKDVEVSVQNKILDMYLRCGSVTDALDLFKKMSKRNLTSWDTMMIGLTNNGLGEDVIDLFIQFKESGLRPDDQMFLGIFSACSALCDVDEGLLHFESMSKVYGIAPSMDHYVGVVKMLGSTGYLDEAVEFIEKMPFEPSVDVWETLMNLCRIHGNLELGDHCAEVVNHLDPSRLCDQSKSGLLPVKASDLAKEKGQKKLFDKNLTDHTTQVKQYKAGDTSQPESNLIYTRLRAMFAQMREAGYIPETRVCLHDVDQESKEEAILAHSEKLAVTSGLISSSARMPLRIIKNLRVCVDCHNALKIIAKLVGRELIVRDAKRFHHFKDGKCSCNDYW